jgi:hypothetical protein
MLPINKKLQLVLIGLACSIVTALAINILIARWEKAGNFAKSVDLYFYNIFFKLAQKPHPRLMIIDSDDKTETRPRADYAQMIRRLREAGAKCIALDIRFLGERDPQEDQELIASVAETPQVIFAIDFSSDQRPPQPTMQLLEQFAFADSVCEILIPKIVAERGVDLPFNELLLTLATHFNHNAMPIGHINSASAQYHHFPPVLPYERKCYASLPIAVAMRYFDMKSDLSQKADSTHSVGDKQVDTTEQTLNFRNLPLDGDGQLLVNFIALENFRPFPYSWQDADSLARANPEHFRKAVVLIVNSAAEPPISTLLGPYPKWAFLASVTNQLLLNSHIDISVLLYPAVFSALISGLGIVLFLFVAPRLSKKWRKTRVVFVFGTLLYLLLIFLMLRYGRLWLGVLTPLLVYNTSMLVVRYRYYQMVKAPHYVNFGIAVLERQKGGYPIKIFEAPGGVEEGNLVLDPAFIKEASFDDALRQLKNLEAVDKDIKIVGDKLFEALFPNEAFYILKSSLEQVGREGKKLRLILHLDSPELVGLPWELMHSAKLPPGHIALNKRVSVLRYLPRAQPVKRQPFRAPLDILVAISSPAGLRPLDVEAERKAITKALLPLIWSGDVRLRFCEHATLDKLLTELKRSPDVLHYIGHSKFDKKRETAFLELETDGAEVDSVEAEKVGNLLHDSTVRLVVLNSCESAAASANDAFTGVAQKLLDVGVPAAVAMQYKIRDDTAMLFSKVFYSTLITNYSIEAAVAEARLRILTGARDDPQGWATPVLFMRTQDGKFFDMES